jgi:hypothetical protein
VTAARRARGRGSRSVRSGSRKHETGRRRRTRDLPGGRSGQRAVKRAAHAGRVSRQADRRDEIRVLFDKLGSHVLARRISRGYLPAGSSARRTPRSGSTESHAPRREIAGRWCAAPPPSIDSTRSWCGGRQLPQRAKGRDARGRVAAPSLNTVRAGARPGYPSQRRPSGSPQPSLVLEHREAVLACRLERQRSEHR